tara:strand:+ start:713 stop:1351 length:639 start_codon:yes stop_codon:yes gene_type:complete
MEKEKIRKSDENVENSENTNSDKEQAPVEKEEEIELEPNEKIKSLEDKVARTLAEMENQRRRYEKEKDDAFEYGGFTFAKEVLNLLDNLERSKQSLENDETLKNNDGLKKIIEHLDIIYNDMISILKKNNIELIKSIGKKLDPNLHQAMLEIEDNSKESGTIVQEIQKGFLMKERLLRPSLVGVSKKKLEKDNNNAQNDKKDEENQEKEEKN